MQSIYNAHEYICGVSKLISTINRFHLVSRGHADPQDKRIFPKGSYYKRPGHLYHALHENRIHLSTRERDMEFVLNSPVTFTKATIIMNVFLISISWGDVVGGKIVIKRHSSRFEILISCRQYIIHVEIMQFSSKRNLS